MHRLPAQPGKEKGEQTGQQREKGGAFKSHAASMNARAILPQRVDSPRI